MGQQCPPGYLLKYTETYVQKWFVEIFIAALIIIAKKWETTQCLSTKEWKNKVWYIYTM